MSNLILKIKADSDAEVKLELLDQKIKKVGKTTRGVGDVLKGVLAARAITQGFMMVQRGFQAMGKEALKYQDTLKNIEGITQSTTKDIGILHRTLMDSTNGMEHTTSKAAETALAINKMGFSAVDTSKALKISLDLATASIVDSTEAATVAVQTMRSFGLELKDLDHVANVIQSTVSGTSINFMEYAEAMKFVAPIADRVGVSLEEMSASIGFLGNIGLKGSIGGTALKNMLLNLLQPGESVEGMLRRMNDEGAGLIDILMQMKSEDMSVTDFLNTFNKRALAGALSLSEVGGGVKALIVDLENEKVKVKEVAEVMRQSLSKQLEILKNNLFNVSNEFIQTAAAGGTFVDAFDPVNDVLQEAQKWIIANDEIVKQFATNVVSLTGDILVLSGKGFKGLIENGDTLFQVLAVLTTLKFASLIAGVNGFGTAMALSGKKIAIAHPWLLAITAAVIAADLAMAKYIDHVDEMVNKTRTLDLDKLSNIQAQSNAMGEYYKEIIAYEQKLQEVKGSAEFGRLGAESKNLRLGSIKNELIGAGNQIELKFGLPANFLDSITDSTNVQKRIAHLYEMESKLVNANANATGENTEELKKVDSILNTLKDSLEERDAKKAAKKAEKMIKETPNEVTLKWSGDLLGDLEDSISKSFTSSQRDPLLQSAGGAELFLNNDSFSSGIKDLIDGFDESIQEIGRFINKEGRMQTPSSLVNDFSSNGFLSPLTQVGPSQGVRNPSLEGGQANIGMVIDPDIEQLTKDIEKKLSLEEFRINLEMAELDNSQTDALASSLELVNTKIKNTEEEIQRLKSALEEVEKETQARFEAIAEGFAQYGDIVLGVFDLIAQVQDSQFEKEQRLLDKRLENTKRERELSIAAHKGIRSAKYLIDKDYDRKEQEILKQKEANEDEYRRKQKAAAIVTALINTALAVTSAIASATTNVERIAMGIAIGALGLAQVGIIASQDYKEGGSIRGGGILISGPGSGTSDSIPTLMSDGEYAIKSRTVNALGGAGGVEDMIEARLNSESSNGRAINVYVENLYDDVDHTRNTMETVMDQTERLVY